MKAFLSYASLAARFAILAWVASGLWEQNRPLAAAGIPAGFFLLLAAARLFENRLFRFVTLFFPVAIGGVQLANLDSTGGLIEPVTLLNLGEASSIGTAAVIRITVISVGWLILWLPTLLAKHARLMPPGFAYPLGVVLCALLWVTPYTFSGSFAHQAHVAYQIEYFEPFPTDGSRFARDRIVNRDTAPVLNGEKLDFKDWNVIVIFAEGTSSAALSETLTPNIARLMKEGINVTGYFNHTAATFRGLRGQLVSGYQLKGGAQAKGDGIGQIGNDNVEAIYRGRLESLPEFLNERGYETVFLSPHPLVYSLNTLMDAIGFKKVITPQADRDDSDKEMYEKLFTEASALAKSGKPFFLATYLAGTHLGRDSPDLKYGSGENSYLNIFYNQDYWFGKFLEKLAKAPFAKKTLLVFTSDHAAYPSPLYKKTFGSNAHAFVDAVPFVIWAPGVKPAAVDLKGENSLVFAPTLSDLLGIRAQKNHFLGHSVFEPDPKNWMTRKSIVDVEVFDVSENKVGPRELVYELEPEKKDAILDFFSFGR
jgi:hypothetical protein